MKFFLQASSAIQSAFKKITFFTLSIILLLAVNSNAQVIWSSASGSAWLTATNWTGSVIPTATQVAEFDGNPTGATGVGINMSGATNNGSHNEAVGAIYVSSSRTSNFLVGNSTTTVAGILTLNGATVNGVNNVVLANLTATSVFSVQNTYSTATNTMGVALGTTTTPVILCSTGSGTASGSTIVINSIMSGSNPITFLGNGTYSVSGTGAPGGLLRLNAVNTFSVGITVGNSDGTSDGILELDNLAAMNNVSGNNITINSNSQLFLPTAGTYTAGNITLNLNGFGNNWTTTGLAAVGGAAVATTWAGPVVLQSNSAIYAKSGGTLTFSGNISGTGSLAVLGKGTVALSGTGNTWSGGTNINNGVLTVNSGSSLSTGPLTFAQNGSLSPTINLNNTSQTVSSLSSNWNSTTGTIANTLVLGSGNTLTINQSSNTTYSSGAVSTLTSIITGSGAIVKQGTGTLTLGSSGHTFSGGLTLTGGSVVLAPPASSAYTLSGAVIMNGGTLGTTGIGAGSTINFGALNLSASSTMSLEATNAHNLKFAASNGVSWTSGQMLTITGWQGSYSGGVAGTKGRIYAGTDATGLTNAQLAQIQFYDGTSYYPATILSTGELVPAASIIVSSISPSGSLCNGTSNVITVVASVTGSVSGTYSVQVAAAGTLTNTTGNIYGTSTTNTITVTLPAGLTAGSYDVRVLNGTPLTVGTTDGGAINVYGSPTITATANSGAVCSGNNLSLNSRITGGTANYTYAWSGPNSFTASVASAALTNTVTVSNVLSSPANPVYTVSITDANNCTTTGTTTATVSATPAPTISGAPASIAAGATAVLTFTGNSGDVIYYWNGSTTVSTTIGGAGTSTVSVSPSATTTYSVTSATSATGCNATITGQTATITVSAMPTAAISGSTAICAGSSANLTFTGTAGATVYYWDGGLGVTSSVMLGGSVGTGTASVSVSPSVTAVYTLTSVYSGGSSYSVTGSATITVNAIPTATITGTAAICSGSSTNISVSGGTPGATINLNGGVASFILDGSGNGSAGVSPTSTTSYTASVTLSGCSQSAAGVPVVTVNTFPTATVTGTATIVSGSGTPLTFSGTPNAVITYAWAGSSSATATLNGTGNYSVSVSPTVTTTYTLTTVVSTAGCSQSVSGQAATITVTAGNNFYSKSSGNLDQLSTWGIATDGTGASPTSFTTSGQTFNIVNNPSATIGAAWSVGTNTVNVGYGGTAINFIIPATFSVTGTGPMNVAATATLTLSNPGLPTLGTMDPASTIYYNNGVANIPSANAYGNVVYNGAGCGIPASTIYSMILAGNLTLQNSATFNDTKLSLYTIGSNNEVISGNGNPISIKTFDNGTTQTKPTGTVTLAANTPLTTASSFISTSTGSANQFSDGGNTITCANNFTTIGNYAGYNLTGTLILTSTGGGAAKLSGNAAFTSVPNAKFNNLIINVGTSNVTFLPTSGGTIYINGNLIVQAISTGETVTLGANTIQLGGNFIYQPATNLLTVTGSTIVFSGATAQTYSTSLSSMALNNVTINNASGLTLNSNMTVSGILGLTSGNITTGSNNINIASTGSVTGASSASYVNGNLNKVMPSSTTSMNYEVGDVSYSPIQLVFGSSVSSGNITVKSTNGSHPSISSSYINTSDFVNRYWTITNSGVSVSSLNASLSYNSSDIAGGGGSNSGFTIRQYSGGSWTTAPSVTNSTTAAAPLLAYASTTTGLSGASFSGDYVAGALACSASAGTVTATPASICGATGTSTLTVMGVTAGTGVSYQWLSSSTGTSTSYAPISGATSASYMPSVSATTYYECSIGCIPTATAAMSGSATVTVSPLPSPTISGSTSISSGSSAVLTFSGNTGDVVYYWNGAASVNTTIGGAGTSTVSVSPTVTTTYSVTSATSAAGCMQAITGQTATINVATLAVLANWATSGESTPTIYSPLNSTEQLIISGGPTIASTSTCGGPFVGTNWMAVNSYWQCDVNTTGFGNITIASFQKRSSGTGPAHFSIQYNNNVGSGWVTVGTYTITSTSCVTAPAYTIAGTSTNNVSDLTIRFINTDGVSESGGAIGMTGTSYFGSLTITGVSANFPSVAISNTNPAVANMQQGSVNNVLQTYNLAVTSADATLSGLTVTPTGTFVSSDINNIKCWYSSSAAFSAGTSTLLATYSSAITSGSNITFPSFTSQAIPSGSTGYIYITTDVASGAAVGDNINLGATAFSNFSLGNASGTATESGTNPVSSTNIQTIISNATCSGTPTAGVASANPSFLCGSGTSTVTLTGGTVGIGINYQWSSSATNASPGTNIPGATSLVYNAPVASATTYYWCTTTCSVSGLSNISSVGTVSVNPVPVVAAITGSTEMVLGSSGTTTLSDATTGTTDTWSSSNTAIATVDPASGIVTGITTGSTTITYGVTTGGCSGVATQSVSVSYPYCIPAMSSSTDKIGIVTSGGVTNITTYVPTSSPEYNNKVASLGIIATAGSTITYTVTNTTSFAGNVGIWVDWNQDQTFTTSLPEQVLTSYTIAATSGTYTASFTVPTTATGGNTVMRLGFGETSGQFATNPCLSNTSDFGNDVDFYFNVLPGFTSNSANDTIIAGNTATFTATVAAGSTYQWQRGISGTYTSIDNTTDGGIYTNYNTTTLNLSSGTTTAISGYTYQLVATNSAGSTTSAPAILVVTPNTGCTGTPLAGSASASTAALCGGGADTLTLTGGTSATGLTYQWSSSAANIAPGTNISGATNDAYVDPSISATTYYWCTTTCTSSGLSNISTAGTVTVNPIPVITVTPDGGTYCSGTSGVNMTASGASTYTWAPATGLNTTAGATVTASSTNNITYTVTGTTSAGCVSANTATVNYLTAPLTPTVTPTSLSVCVGGTTNLLSAFTGAAGPVSSASGAVNITTAGAGNGTASSAITVSGIPSGTTITTVSVTVDFSSNFVNDYIINLVAPNGDILNLVNQEGAHGAGSYTGTVISSAGITALSAGTGSFTATFAADEANGVGHPGTASDVTSWSDLYSVPNGTWTLVVYNNSSFANTATLNDWSINVNYSLPSVTWSPATNLYTDSAATTSYTGAVTDSVYEDPSVAGTIVYTATATNGGCTSSATNTVTVNPIPTATITGTATICSGSATNISVAGGTPGAIVSLNGGAVSFTLDVSGNGSASVTPTATTTYTATVTSGSCSAIAAGTPTVTVNPLAATPGAITGSLTATAGNTATLSDTTGGGVWSSSNSSVATISASGVVAAISSGTTTIGYTVSNSCGSASVTAVFTVPTSPVVIAGTQWNGIGATSPTASTFSVVPGATTPGSSFVNISQWNRFGATYMSTASVYNTTDFSASTAFAGALSDNRYIYFTITNGSGTEVNVSSIGLYGQRSSTGPQTLQMTYATGNSGNIVFGDVETAPTSLAYNNFTGSVCIAPGQTDTFKVFPYNPSTAGSTGGTYRITNTTSVTATYVNSVTTLTAASAANNSPVCEGSTLDLTGGATSNGVAPYTYSWSGPSSYSSISFSPVISSATSGATGTYTFIATDNMGCTVAGTTTATVNPLPSPTISGAPATIAAGGSAVLTFAGNSGDVVYYWDGATTQTTTITGVGTSTVSVTPSVTTTYSVTSATSAAGCSQSITGQTVTINVTATPTAAISGSATICAGTNTALSFSGTAGATVYYWDGGMGATASITLSGSTGTGTASVSVSPTVTATYTLTSVFSGGTSYPVTGSATVTVNPLPATPASITGTLTAMAGGTTTLGDATGSGVWSSSNTSVATISTSGAVAALSAGTTTISYTVSNSCGNVSATAIYTVTPIPSSGTIVTAQWNGIGASSPTASTFSVVPGATIPGSSYINVSQWNRVGGTYQSTASVYNTTGFSASTTFAGALSDNDYIYFTVTNGASTEVNVSSIGLFGQRSGTGPQTLQMTYSTGNSGNILFGGVATAPTALAYNTFTGSVCIAPGQTDTFKVFPYNPSTAGSTGGTYRIANTTSITATYVNSVTAFITTAAASNSPVCVGGALDLTGGAASNGVSPYTYNWSGPSSYSSTSLSPVILPATSGVAGIYTFIATDNMGCTVTNTTTATVNPLPNPTISGAPATIVAGGSAVLTFTGNSGDVVYYWDGATTQTTTITGAGTSTISVTPSATTTYSVTSATSAAGCSQTIAGQIVTITISAAPTAAISGSATICASASTALSFSGTAGATVYYWDGGMGVTSSVMLSGSTGTGTATVTVSPTVTATYTLTSVYSSGTSYPVTGSATVTVNPLPTASISGTTSIPAGLSTPLTFTGTNNAVITYAWAGPSSATATLSGSGTYSVAVSPTVSTTYTLTTVTSAAGCTQAISGQTAVVTVTAGGSVVNITGNSPAADSAGKGSANVLLETYNLSVTTSAATLSGLTVTTAGSYVSADITDLKCWYSTSSTLDATATLLSTYTTPGAAGSKVFPSFTAQSIPVGTGYIFITADIATGATTPHTINIASTALPGFNLGSAVVTGSTITASNSLTIMGYSEPLPYSLAGGSWTLTGWSAATPALYYPVNGADGSGAGTATPATSANMVFHSMTGTDPTLANTALADYTSGYAATSSTRMNGEGTSGFAWINTSSGDNLGEAVLGVNTTGRNYVQVSWTGGAISVTAHVYYVKAQYRIGTTGAYTDLPNANIYQITDTTSTVVTQKNFGPITLPATCDNQPDVEIRWVYYAISGSGNRPEKFVTNIDVTSNAIGATPSVAISNNSPAAANVTPGTNNLVLQTYDMNVTGATDTITGLTIITGGNYFSGDVTDFKLWYDTAATFNSGTATLLSTITSPSGPGNQVFPAFAQTMDVIGGTKHIFVTADVSSSAISGDSINVAATPFSNINLGITATATGTNPVPAANYQDIYQPSVNISSASPATGNIGAGTINNVIQVYSMAVTTSAATISGLTVTTGGTYTTADVTNFKCWYSPSAIFNTVTATLLSSKTTSLAVGTQVFPSFTAQAIPVGTGYIFVTTDLTSGATLGDNISVLANSFSEFNMGASLITGTNPVAASNVQTIAAATVAISNTSPATQNVGAGRTNVILQTYDLGVSSVAAAITAFTVTTVGSYTASDISDMECWYSASSTFNAGTATLLSTIATPGAAGNQVFPSFISQTIPAGTTGYLFITTNIASAATAGHTINVAANSFSNFNFGSATLTGTNPVPAANVLTIATYTDPVPYDLSLGTYDFNNWPSTSAAGTYPANMIFHFMNVAYPTLTSTAAGDYVVAYDYATATRISGQGANGYSMDNTGSGNGSGPASTLGESVLGINTTGRSNIEVSWTAGTIAASSAVSLVRAQYRIGTTGSYTDLPNTGVGQIEDTSAATGASKNFGPITLPASCEGQPDVEIRWVYYQTSSNSTEMYVTNIQVVSSASVAASVAISATSPSAANVAVGTSNVLLQTYDLAVTAGTAFMGGLSVNTAGTYTSSDVTDLKYWYSASSTFNSSTATLLSTNSAVAAAGTQVFPSFTTQPVAVGSGYIFITADIAAGATVGDNIEVSSTPFSDFNFGSATLTGTDPVAASSLQTIAAPASIAITNTSPAIGNIYASNSYVLQTYNITVSSVPAEISGLTVNLNGTYATTDISDIKCWYSTSSTFSTSTATLLSTNSSVTVAGAQTFASFTSQTLPVGTSYIFITTDVAALPTTGNTIYADATPNADFNVGTASITSTGPVAAANIQTIAVHDPAPYNLATSGAYIFNNWPSTSAAGTYPGNMIFHYMNAADPLITSVPSADYTGVYTATGTSGAAGMVGLGTSGFAFFNKGGVNLGEAVLAINTTNQVGINVSWVDATVAVYGARTYAIKAQYRIGTTGSYTDLSSNTALDEYTSTGSAVGSYSFAPVTLPASCENQPDVEIRWLFYYIGSTTGARPELSVTDIQVTGNAPAATITGGATFCASGTTTVSVTGGTPGALVTLTPGGASFTLDTTGAGSVAVTSTVTTTYTATVSKSGVSAAASGSVLVTITSAPVISAIIPSTTSICVGGSLVLNADTTAASGMDLSYAWSGPDGFSSTAIAPSLTATTDAGGIYSLTVTSAAGCVGAPVTSPSVAVNSVATVSVTASPAGIVCSGHTETLTATATGGAGVASYTWSGPGITGTAGPFTSGTYTVIPSGSSASGAYSVAVSYSVSTGCAMASATSGTVTITGEQWTGTTSTDWSNAANWICGSVPIITDDVIIAAGTTYAPVLNTGIAYANNLTITTGVDSLNLSSGTQLNIAGNLVNNSAVTGSGIVYLNGTSSQLLSGNGMISNLTVDNASGVSINTTTDTVGITGTLLLNSGTLTTNGRLMLVSNENTTGRIGDITGGQLSGNVTIQQYIAGGKRAYRFWAHPFSTSIPLSQVYNYIDITGAGGSTNGFTTTASNAPSAYWYHTIYGNSSLGNDPGWMAFTNTYGTPDSNMLHQYEGMRLYIRGSKGEGLTGAAYIVDPVTIRMWGAVNTGDQSVVMRKGTGENQDYSLLGNPYPSPTDIGTVINNANVSGLLTGAAFYIWDPHMGLNGQFIAESIGSPYFIGANESYEVRTVADGNVLSFSESNKVSTVTDILMRNLATNGLSLSIYDTSYLLWDMLDMKFNDAATDSEDARYDGQKPSGPAVLNFYSLSSDNSKLSIDSRPFVSGKVVPLGITSSYAQDFIIRAESIAIPTGDKIYLHDKYLQSYTLLQQGTEYKFSITSDTGTQGNKRFELALNPTEKTAALNTGLQLQMVPNPAADAVTINFSASSKAATGLKIMDMEGVVIINKDLGVQQNGNVTVGLDDLAAGIYLVEFTSGNEKVVQRLVKE